MPEESQVARILACPPEPRLDRRLLLQSVLQRSHAWLASHPEYALQPAELTQFRQLLALREQGRPMAYLLGFKEFHGLELAVSPSVLIPRPETEGLVDWALELLPEHSSARVLDMGTGSGAIAVSLLYRRPELRITATDISAGALEIAKTNAQRWQPAESRPIDFYAGNWFAGLPSRAPYHLILSNPPYVNDDDPHLDQGDVRHEPDLALKGGKEGLDALRILITEAPSHLRQGGWLLLEHGYDQGASCRELLCSSGFSGITTRTDLAGIGRLTGGYHPSGCCLLPHDQD